MKPRAFLPTASVIGILMLALTGLAHSADLSHTVFLVATSALDGSPYAQSVIVATPLPNGEHIGFIVNKPTTVGLAEAFPEDVAARNVKEPLYLGGPELLPGVFAITRTVPEGKGTFVALMPGLVAVIDGESVDRVIATTPNEARYFVGLMLWNDEDLYAQVRAKLWEVRPADVEQVFRAKATGLWKALRGPTASVNDSSRQFG